MIYKCRAPFMSRIGQFDAGKQTLVCGILESVIYQGKGDFKMTLSGSPKEYKISYENLKKARHTIWVNRAGKRVWIVPVGEFEFKEVAKEEKVEEKKQEEQGTLF